MAQNPQALALQTLIRHAAAEGKPHPVTVVEGTPPYFKPVSRNPYSGQTRGDLEIILRDQLQEFSRQEKALGKAKDHEKGAIRRDISDIRERMALILYTLKNELEK